MSTRQTSWKGIERLDEITDDGYKYDVVEFKLDSPPVSVVARTGGYSPDEKDSKFWRVFLVDKRLDNPICPICLVAFVPDQRGMPTAIAAAECAARAIKVVCSWTRQPDKRRKQNDRTNQENQTRT